LPQTRRRPTAGQPRRVQRNRRSRLVL
jgi:hypothetical protein